MALRRRLKSNSCRTDRCVVVNIGEGLWLPQSMFEKESGRSLMVGGYLCFYMQMRHERKVNGEARLRTIQSIRRGGLAIPFLRQIEAIESSFCAE